MFDIQIAAVNHLSSEPRVVDDEPQKEEEKKKKKKRKKNTVFGIHGGDADE